MMLFDGYNIYEKISSVDSMGSCVRLRTVWAKTDLYRQRGGKDSLTASEVHKKRTPTSPIFEDKYSNALDKKHPKFDHPKMPSRNFLPFLYLKPPKVHLPLLSILSNTK